MNLDINTLKTQKQCFRKDIQAYLEYLKNKCNINIELDEKGITYVYFKQCCENLKHADFEIQSIIDIFQQKNIDIDKSTVAFTILRNKAKRIYELEKNNFNQNQSTKVNHLLSNITIKKIKLLVADIINSGYSYLEIMHKLEIISLELSSINVQCFENGAYNYNILANFGLDQETANIVFAKANSAEIDKHAKNIIAFLNKGLKNELSDVISGYKDGISKICNERNFSLKEWSKLSTLSTEDVKIILEEFEQQAKPA